MADLGLAVLAGAGALALAEAWRRRRGGASPAPIFAAASFALLFEERAAPLELFPRKGRSGRGDEEARHDPDERGPRRAAVRNAGRTETTSTFSGGGPRQASRERRVGLQPPHRPENRRADRPQGPIPDDLLDLFEGLPTSYVLVRESWLDPAMRTTHRAWIDRALVSGRLVFVKRFDGDVKNDLFAVAKNEPLARPLEPLPWTPPGGLAPSGLPWREDAALTGNIDAPEEGAAVKGTLRIRGWARIPGEDLHVTLLVDGEQRPLASGSRTPRPDVCAAVPALGDCSQAGFDGTFAFLPGDAGPHEIVALFRSKDGRERHYPPRKFTWQGGR